MEWGWGSRPWHVLELAITFWSGWGGCPAESIRESEWGEEGFPAGEGTAGEQGIWVTYGGLITRNQKARFFTIEEWSYRSGSSEYQNKHCDFGLELTVSTQTHGFQYMSIGLEKKIQNVCDYVHLYVCVGGRTQIHSLALPTVGLEQWHWNGMSTARSPNVASKDGSPLKGNKTP